MLPHFELYTYISQFFWLALCFGVLYLGLSVFILPKINRIIREREEIIVKNIEHAKACQEVADMLLLEKQSKIVKSQKLSDSLMQKTNVSIENYRQLKLGALETKLKELTNQFEEEKEVIIESEKHKNNFIKKIVEEEIRTGLSI